jgi:type I restriction enzyme R subunit
MKEATARTKINKLLEASGRRFFADSNCPANIQHEPTVAIHSRDLDTLRDYLERTERGYTDFLVFNEKEFPFIGLGAIE